MLNFLQEYFPASHRDNLMWCEGDVVEARRRYIERPLSNLTFLLRKRMSWMNDFIPSDARLAVEIGCGMGVTRDFVKAPALMLTDYSDHPWVEKKVDALNMPFADGGVDVLIANNVIHHLAYPSKFFREAQRVLKPGGRILIQEINASLAMRAILRLMRHEGYSLRQNPFDESRPCNDPRDLWSANCAMVNLLFDDEAAFERQFPALEVERQEPCEFFIFPLSGGVIAKSPTVPLPEFALRAVDAIDEALVKLFPGTLALQRRVVLRRRTG